MLTAFQWLSERPGERHSACKECPCLLPPGGGGGDIRETSKAPSPGHTQPCINHVIWLVEEEGPRSQGPSSPALASVLRAGTPASGDFSFVMCRHMPLWDGAGGLGTSQLSLVAWIPSTMSGSVLTRVATQCDDTGSATCATGLGVLSGLWACRGPAG